ncbi:hypothetical protein HNV12_04410 [Methanococcoides sp. SA1]|nr:hypothetical protein [Methanococcoides sp. SA1]
MATLDRVIQMQQENKSDNEIMAQLQNEGVAPGEISNALQQAQIKNAVAPPQETTVPEGMQPSIMPDQSQPQTTQPTQPQTQELPVAQPQTQSAQPQLPPIQQPQTPQQQTPEYQPQEYYPETPQAYGGQDYYGGQESYGTETISEIATQIAAETLADYKTKVGDVASFKNKIQNKVEDLDDRLKRIENSIDKLQQAIIGKIGEFGDSTAMIHKDLDNLHGTVANLMNPLIDNINALDKHAKKKSSKK